MRYAISCCAGNNAFSELFVERVRSLIRFTTADRQTDMTPADVKILINLLEKLLLEMKPRD